MSGLVVEGQRTTRTIPEGVVGNDRPFTTSDERWHSKELDLDLEVKRTDPRAGMRDMTMTEINVGEPDPKKFEVPEGYQVVEGGTSNMAFAPVMPPGGELPLPSSLPPPR
jgi:hypothetical protein